MQTKKKNAWMDSSVFKKWFHGFMKTLSPAQKKFLNEKELPHKALLILDNAPTHPNESELVFCNIRAILFAS
jgi:hypothetical protein